MIIIKTHQVFSDSYEAPSILLSICKISNATIPGLLVLGFKSQLRDFLMIAIL